jgi:hypothetical protein
MTTGKKMAVVTVFMAAVLLLLLLLLATVESAAAAAAPTAPATPSDSNQQLGLGARRKLLQINSCGGNSCVYDEDCCPDYPLCVYDACEK